MLISYEDRYLRPPAPDRVLYEVLKQVAGNDTKIKITTANAEEERIGRLMDHNWSSPLLQKNTIESVLQTIGQTTVKLERIRDMEHARTLRLYWSETDRAEILLDHGFGFLRCSPSMSHDFLRPAKEQARSLLGQSYSVQQTVGRTPVYLRGGG